jgi:hypothetical protein
VAGIVNRGCDLGWGEYGGFGNFHICNHADEGLRDVLVGE